MRAADARLAATPGIGSADLVRLQRSHVAVIGLGVLGGQITYHLGLLGTELTLIDCGRVELVNLGNQGFETASVGEWKSVVRRRQIGALNPECRAHAVVAPIEDLGLAALAGVNLLVTGLDGRAARVRVNEIAWRLGVPWIDAAVDGSGRWLRGTVSVRAPGADTACYVCRYDGRDLACIAREGRGRGCPSWRRANTPATSATLQGSAFAAVVAGFQATWATRALLGHIAVLAGRELVLDADTMPAVTLRTLQRNPRCLFDHEPLGAMEHAPGTRVADLLDVATLTLAGEVDEITFHERTVALGLTCARCGHERDLVRLTHAYADAEVRCGCGTDAEMTPRRLVTSIRRPELSQIEDSTWDALGIPRADVVTVRAGARRLHYVVNDHTGGSDV